MDPIKVDFSGKGRAKELYIPPERAGLKTIISIILTLVVAVLAFYFMLPAINIKAYDFYSYIGVVLLSYIVFTFISSKAFARPEYIPYVKKRSFVPIVIGLVFAIILGIGYLSSALIFRAKTYSKIISVEEQQFGEESGITNIAGISDFEKIPMIDADVAANLGNKKLGDLAQFVSQFVIDNPYSTQINFRGVPTRILPLKYGDFFKWFNNRGNGIPAYIAVNMYTQEANAVTVEGGIKYSSSEYFGRKLARVLRFNYPTYMFGVPSLEINEDGDPWWVCERIDKTIGLVGGEDVTGLVLVNARTGETKEYSIDKVKAENSDIKWVDQVYSADLLNKQYNYYGKYCGGFFNSFIGQTGVKITTSGYSYLTNNDDVWMYTGVTSVTNDDSIIGFALINQRTKKAFFQKISGTTEAGAQASAESIVSDKGWKATFPLVLNIKGEATYFMALKDNNVVKSYAMVSVERVQDAARSPNDDYPNLVACLKSYESTIKASGINLRFNYEGKETDIDTSLYEFVTGAVDEIRTAVIGGESVYYIKLKDSAAYYSISASQSDEAIILNKGDTVIIAFEKKEDRIIPAQDIRLK
ncbi:MAG: hypothetical protein BWY46_00858 [Firmicutes bacterium ADurb.Bin300]|nr:MAG: hypothetical protein BWY46_00858 [Firmicutes bacterium ADurb.Bin300]